MDMMGTKAQLLEELLEKLASQDGMNLKSKVEVAPMPEDDKGEEMNAMADGAECGDDMGEDDLKQLLSHYMGM